eukprot:EG_transcript_23223
MNPKSKSATCAKYHISNNNTFTKYWLDKKNEIFGICDAIKRGNLGKRKRLFWVQALLAALCGLTKRGKQSEKQGSLVGMVQANKGAFQGENPPSPDDMWLRGNQLPWHACTAKLWRYAQHVVSQNAT